LFRFCGGQSKAFQIDEAADTGGADTSVLHDHITAHAVAQQVDRPLGLEVVDQGVKVGQVVGEPKIVHLAGVGQAIAAPVGRDDVAVDFERIDHELERGADIHPAMHHEKRQNTRLGCSPFPDVVIQMAQRDEAAARGALDLVHCADHKDVLHDHPSPLGQPRAHAVAISLAGAPPIQHR
jgi:hypothetical protein